MCKEGLACNTWFLVVHSCGSRARERQRQRPFYPGCGFLEIVIVLGWATAEGLPNREQSLFLVFHDKDVG